MSINYNILLHVLGLNKMNPVTGKKKVADKQVPIEIK